MLVTFRPEFEPPWIGRPYVTALTINLLAERDVSAMIDRVIGNKRLPPNIQENIVERSDAILLFVEEMTKAVLEAGTVGAADQIAAVQPYWIASAVIDRAVWRNRRRYSICCEPADRVELS
jgi:predicted ATPase